MSVWTHIFTISLTLFLLMDSIGNLPIFIALLKEIPAKRQRAIIFRELVIALVIIIAFAFVGEFILEALGVSEQTILVSGGVILFLIAIKMIFPSRRDAEVDMPQSKEPFIVPLAVPLVAGPAVLATVMVYSKQNVSTFTLITAIIIAWAISTIILLCSSYLKRLLGWRGIIACERLMGLILTLLAVEMFLKGLSICFGRI